MIGAQFQNLELKFQKQGHNLCNQGHNVVRGATLEPPRGWIFLTLLAPGWDLPSNAFWLWHGDWNEQINIITQMKIKNPTLVWR